MRIGYIERMANPRVAADVRANTRACLAAWEAMGATVEEVTDTIDWIEYEGRVLYQAGFAVTCAQYLPKWQNQMDPVTLAFMERGAKFTWPTSATPSSRAPFCSARSRRCSSATTSSSRRPMPGPRST